MVKYRQATQKLTDVCFTGRGRMEWVKKLPPSDSVCSWFTQRMDNCSAVQTIWRFVEFLWKCFSEGEKKQKTLLNGMTVSQKGTVGGIVVSALSAPSLYNLPSSVWNSSTRQERTGKTSQRQLFSREAERRCAKRELFFQKLCFIL